MQFTLHQEPNRIFSEDGYLKGTLTSKKLHSLKGLKKHTSEQKKSIKNLKSPEWNMWCEVVSMLITWQETPNSLISSVLCISIHHNVVMVIMSVLFQWKDIQKGKGEENRRGWKEGRRRGFLMFSVYHRVCYSLYCNRPLLGSYYSPIEEKMGFLYLKRRECLWSIREGLWGIYSVLPSRNLESYRRKGISTRQDEMEAVQWGRCEDEEGWLALIFKGPLKGWAVLLSPSWLPEWEHSTWDSPWWVLAQFTGCFPSTHIQGIMRESDAGREFDFHKRFTGSAQGLGKPGLTEWPVVTCACLQGWAQAKTEDAKKGVSILLEGWLTGAGEGRFRLRVWGTREESLWAGGWGVMPRVGPMPTEQLYQVCFPISPSPNSSRSVPRSFYGNCIFVKWILFLHLPVLFPEMFLSFLLGPQLYFHKL